jgi:hypothetical protein
MLISETCHLIKTNPIQYFLFLIEDYFTIPTAFATSSVFILVKTTE